MEARSEVGASSIEVTIRFDPPVLARTPAGIAVALTGFEHRGRPGDPALPRTVVRVAVPFGRRVTGVEFRDEKIKRLTDEAVVVAPVQQCQPAQGGRGDQSSVRYFRQPTLPNVDAYEGEAARERHTVRPLGEERVGYTRTAVLELQPVRYVPGGALSFAEATRFAIGHEPIEGWPGKSTDGPRPAEEIDPELPPWSPAQAERFRDLARALVLNPDLVTKLPSSLVVRRPVDYLIVTTEALASRFQRLADWKWRRGLLSRVVTLEAIERDQFGDFRTNALDKPEMLRRFLQWAFREWGIAWVLIGATDDVIPARRVAGCSFNEAMHGSQDPPPKGMSFWTGSYHMVHFTSAPDPAAQIVRLADGRLIPYVDPVIRPLRPPTGPTWHFSTDDSYATSSRQPTEYVRISHPAPGGGDADFHFTSHENLIPTDLYYADLRRAPSGRRDWDETGNGLYGQHTRGASPDHDLDGVAYHADVSVGRAPVRSGGEADAFIAKVIAYEAGKRRDGRRSEVDWYRTVVLAAGNWWGRLWPANPGTNDPPALKEYLFDGIGKTLIHFEGAPPWIDWSLVAVVSESDTRVLPFDPSAKQGGRGWHWVLSDTNQVPSLYTFSVFGQVTTIGVPTEWVVVYGPQDELTPRQYLLDQESLDEAAATQEERRAALPTDLGLVPAVVRLYEDNTDVPAAQRRGASLAYLSEQSLAPALDQGPHFVSLIGHGNNSWTCNISTGTWRTLSNQQPFIAFSTGCETAQYDMVDSFGQVATSGTAGAVAYIGNSVFGWIPGPGRAMAAAFFGAVGTARNLGVAQDARLKIISPTVGWDERWSVFTQNLFGDPEMRVWHERPRPLVIDVDRSGSLIDVMVAGILDDHDTRTKPVTGARVTATQDDRVIGVAMSDGEGRARLELADDTRGAIKFGVFAAGHTYAESSLKL